MAIDSGGLSAKGRNDASNDQSTKRHSGGLSGDGAGCRKSWRESKSGIFIYIYVYKLYVNSVWSLMSTNRYLFAS